MEGRVQWKGGGWGFEGAGLSSCSDSVMRKTGRERSVGVVARGMRCAARHRAWECDLKIRSCSIFCCSMHFAQLLPSTFKSGRC